MNQVTLGLFLKWQARKILLEQAAGLVEHLRVSIVYATPEDRETEALAVRALVEARKDSCDAEGAFIQSAMHT